MNKTYSIFTEVDTIKSNYENTSLEKVSGLTRSQAQIIKMCEYYSDSRYMGTYVGNKKTLGDGAIDIPFANVVNFRVSLAKTATDLDIKDFQAVSDKPEHQMKAIILNHELYEWMKKTGFSLTLNQMGLNRPKYGGYLVKKNEMEDDIKIDVVRWTNVWTDQNDILGGAIVETHHMSPVEIKKKDGTWRNVNEVLKAHKSMKEKDRPTVIDVLEVTGEFPMCHLSNALGQEETEEDEFFFKLQRHFIADLDGNKFLMHSEPLKGVMEDYYGYLSWEENGFGLGRGVIEESEEVQVWTNDSVINETIAMSLAGRAGIITDSKKLGNNILQHDHGKVYKQDKGDTTTAFNIVPAALGQYANVRAFWQTVGDNATSSFNSITGGQPPSGTPYSQTALLNQVATKPFEYKRQEWGIHLTWLIENWILPDLIKKLNKKHILVSDYSDQELDMIDDSFAHHNANEDMKPDILNPKISLDPNNPTPNPVTPERQAGLIEGYKKHIKKHGKIRYLDIPDDYFDDFETKITVITTGEQRNKSLILQGLQELRQDAIASFNPTTGEYGMFTDPNLSKLYNQTLELINSGVTPADIGKGTSPTKPPTQQVPQAPVPAQKGGLPALMS